MREPKKKKCLKYTKVVIMKNRVLPFFVAVFTTISVFAQEPKMQVVDKVVAVVGKNIILQSDVENQYMQYRMQGDIEGSGTAMRCAILEELLFQKLMLNQAEMDSVTITDNEVETELSRRISELIGRAGSQEKLESIFNKTMSEIKDELRRLVKEKSLQDKVRAGILEGVVVTPAEVKAFYRGLPSDSLPMVGTEYEIMQIVKRPPISIDEKLAVKNQLYEIRKRILEGESSFSTMAILYSEDPGSAKKGGELGFTGRGEFAPEFEATAFNLRDGEISEVIETQFGYHIVQLIERRGEYVNCRHILMKAKVPVEALEKAQQELDSAARLIRNGDLTFEEACKKFSDDESKTNGGYIVNPMAGGYRIGLQDIQELENYPGFEEFKNLAFVISKLDEGVVSDPVPMVTSDNKDAFRLVMVKKKYPSHKANLEDDYWRIQTWALNQKNQEVIQDWIRKKAKKAFIRVDEEYAGCGFQFEWQSK
ncbi:MAG: peptidylprolyl isomerase [Bacteroidales bacterium]|nr:peptidylprolyl isomerase [Bacteroidales bacterium]